MSVLDLGPKTIVVEERDLDDAMLGADCEHYDRCGKCLLAQAFTRAYGVPVQVGMVSATASGAQPDGSPRSYSGDLGDEVELIDMFDESLYAEIRLMLPYTFEFGGFD